LHLTRSGRDPGRLAMEPPPAPPSDAEFAAAMATLGPFERRPGIAVGVSGGPDSMALALLLKAWVEARHGRLLALVVDHCLRAGSTAEAAAVAKALDALGIEAQILTRSGPLPRSAVQAAARAARYALLEQATAAAGFLHLAVAHHARDQLETVALRRASSSGPRGLAGMPAIRELDRVRLIRPLLGIAPERLKTLLRERGVGWLDDPANRDPRFWRGRFRSAQPPEDDGAAGTVVAARRQALDREIAAWLARHARPHHCGFIAVPLAALVGTADDLLPALLARLVTATAGAVWPPGRAKLERLVDWLRAGTTRRMVLGGVMVERGAAGMVRFSREPRAVAGPAPLGPGGMLWDGRFSITWPEAPDRVVVDAAGPGWRGRLSREPAHRSAALALAAVPASVLATLPLVSVDGRAVALGPSRLGYGAEGLRIRFRPQSRYADLPFGQSGSTSVA
jgi:tRNA(Ile)-lysidine synthase